MNEEQYKITNSAWDDTSQEMRYTLARCEEDPNPFTLLVGAEGRKKVRLLFWQGDPDVPTNILVAQTDPIELSYEKNRVCFYEVCGPVRGVALAS